MSDQEQPDGHFSTTGNFADSSLSRTPPPRPTPRSQARSAERGSQIHPAHLPPDRRRATGASHPANRIAELTPRLWRQRFADKVMHSDFARSASEGIPPIGTSDARDDFIHHCAPVVAVRQDDDAVP